jgi:hypothetical protein
MCQTHGTSGRVMRPAVTSVTYIVKITQLLRRSGIPIIVILTRAAREPAHNNGCNPFTETVWHPWYRTTVSDYSCSQRIRLTAVQQCQRSCRRGMAFYQQISLHSSYIDTIRSYITVFRTAFMWQWGKKLRDFCLFITPYSASNWGFFRYCKSQKLIWRVKVTKRQAKRKVMLLGYNLLFSHVVHSVR